MIDIESRLELVSPGTIVLVLPRAKTIDGSVLGCVQKVDIYKSPVRDSRAIYIGSPAHIFVKREIGSSGVLRVPCIEKVQTELVCASRAQYAPVILPLDCIGDVRVGVGDICQALIEDPFFRYMAPYFTSFRT